MSKPYPWARNIFLTEAQAPKVYRLEDRLKNIMEDLTEALKPHVGDDKWKQAVPYMLFSILESYDNEASIAAALGFLKHVAEGDLQHDMKRESLEGLELPKEP